MFRKPYRSISDSVFLLLLAVSLTACGGSSSNDSSNPPVIQDSTDVSGHDSQATQDDVDNSDSQATQGDISTLPPEPPHIIDADDSDSQAPQDDINTLPPAPPRITNARGALLGDGEHLRTNTLAESNTALADPGIKSPPAIPVYDVRNYRLNYLTLDGNGELTEASGLIAVPQKPAGFYSPLLSFQHGTIFYDREAPSNDPSPRSPASIMASQGYIVLAADYIGYGASKGKPHPYLQAAPSAAAVVDFIAAARQWLAEQRIPVNEQLFLTGYSEGGYVTMAAQQALEQAGIPVTATVAGAGPYDLKYTLDELLNTREVLDALGGVIGDWWQNLRPESNPPPTAARYENRIDEARVDVLMYFLIPKDSDVEFDKAFLLDWMSDDDAAMRLNSVHDWLAVTPIRLIHGRDDATVPFGNSTRALNAMRDKGTGDIELEECVATPSDHSDCVRPYGQLLLNYFSSFARDL